jgi:hypothetical protein
MKIREQIKRCKMDHFMLVTHFVRKNNNLRMNIQTIP